MRNAGSEVSHSVDLGRSTRDAGRHVRFDRLANQRVIAFDDLVDIALKRKRPVFDWISAHVDHFARERLRLDEVAFRQDHVGLNLYPKWIIFGVLFGITAFPYSLV